MACLAVSPEIIALSSPTLATVLVKSGEEIKKIELDVPQHVDEKAKKNVTKIDSESESVSVTSDISSSGRYLAVCSGKKLSVWSVSEWTLLSSRDIVRSASKITFTPKESHIVLADKSGDVYLCPVTDEDPCKLILGHLSVILDVLITTDEKYVITCDRDEKIRVSHFPNSYNINSYCLGHKEFVSCLKIVPHDGTILVSGSGDGSVKFWRFTEGLELFSYQLCDLPSSIISASNNNPSMAVDSLEVLRRDELSSLVCVSLTRVPLLIVLVVGQNNSLLLCKYHSFIDTISEPLCLSISNEKLWLLSGSNEAKLLLFEWNMKEDKFIKNEAAIAELLGPTKVDLCKIFKTFKSIESIEYLFKKKYDNVQDYLEKKKARMEASALV